MLFPRRRRDEATPGPAPAADRPVPAELTARRDWAQLPSLQLITTGIDRVIDTRFDADLSSWHAPGILRPLDHAVSTDGPSGMVLDSIARSVLPARESPSVSGAGTAVQRVVTFEPPRRPTATFTPDAPRSIEAVTFDAGEPAPSSGAEPEPEWLVETSESVAVENRAAAQEMVATEPAVAPANEPDAVAPTLGPAVTAPAPAPAPLDEPPAPPPPAPIQRRADLSGRPLGLGAPLRSPSADVEGPSAPGQLAPSGPSDVSPPRPGPGAMSPAAAPPAAPPRAVQRDRSDDEPVDGTDMAAPAATPSAVQLPAAAVDVPVAVIDAPPAATTEPTPAPTSSTPLLGDQPLLATTTDADPPGGTTARAAGRVVQRRRAGLGPPSPAPAGTAPVPLPPGAPLELAAPTEPTEAGPEPSVITVAAFASAEADADRAASAPDASETMGAGDTEPAPAEPPATAPLLSAAVPIVELAAAPPEWSGGAAAPAPHHRPGGERATPAAAPAGGGPSGAPLSVPIQRLVPSPPPSAAIDPQPPSAVAPTLGTRPRSSHPPTAGGDEPTPSEPTPALGPVPVAAAAAAPTQRVVALLGERSLTPAVAPPTAQREGAPTPVQRATATAAALLSPTAPPRVPPSFASFGPTNAVSWVDAGSVAVEAGVAQRQADGSVVFGMGAPDVAGAPPDGADAQVVQRAAEGTPAVTGAPHGADGADLDELAKRLYGRLRVMLKHELRLDRERAGVLTQVRR